MGLFIFIAWVYPQFSLSPAEKVIVGVSGHVITERQHTVAPSDQLAGAQQFIQLGKKPRVFLFTYEVHDASRKLARDRQASTVSETIYFWIVCHPPYCSLGSHACLINCFPFSFSNRIPTWFPSAAGSFLSMILKRRSYTGKFWDVRWRGNDRLIWTILA